jgi:hypothetical protein
MTQHSSAMLDDKSARAARRRSVAIGLTLAALVLLFYAATIVHMGGSGVMNVK